MRTLTLVLFCALMLPKLSAEPAGKLPEILEGIENSIRQRVEAIIFRTLFSSDDGMLAEVKQLAEVAKVEIAPDVGLLESVAAIEKKMRLKINGGDGLINRVKNLQTAVAKDRANKAFEQGYGIPQKMSVEERVAASQRFLDRALIAERAKKRTGAPEKDRIELLETQFPSLAKEDPDSFDERLVSFEKVLRPRYKEKEPSNVTRLAALEDIADGMFLLKQKSAREKLNSLERAELVKATLANLKE